MQLALQESDDEQKIVSGRTELPPDAQSRVKMIQKLMAARGTEHYAKAQQQTARSLGISVRSLQRMVKAWRSVCEAYDVLV
jgi:putative transposase